jgi:putative hydrolase of the HAD superfamily
MAHRYRDVMSFPVIPRDVSIVVSDLDGVLRHFDPALWDVLDEAAGVEPGTVFQAILRDPFLDEVVRGRATHSQWRGSAEKRLRSHGVDPDVAQHVVQRWANTPGAVDEDVRGSLLDLRQRGTAVFVLTNGTDRVRDEIDALGLDDVVGASGEWLLNSAELGPAKPDAEAFRRAHGRIEAQVSEPIRRGRVFFVDDSERHVRGAKEFGWQAVLCAPPMVTRPAARVRR